MAKKARKRLEEAEATAFEFPEFDERGFMDHEFEQSFATAISLAIAVALGAVSFALTHALANAGAGILEGIVPVVVGIGIIASTPLFVGRLRAKASTYTKGDWASMILMELFGWLGVWFLLTDVLLR